MPLLFDDGATDNLTMPFTAITAAPFTLAIGVNSDDVTDSEFHGALTLADASVSNMYFSLGVGGNIASDPVQIFVTATTGISADAIGVTINTWHHAADREVGAANHNVYIDGGTPEQETTSKIPTGIDEIGIGFLNRSTGGFDFSGILMWAALWNVALTVGEVEKLAAGYEPPHVNRGALKFYSRLNAIIPMDLVTHTLMTVDAGSPEVKNDYPPAKMVRYEPRGRGRVRRRAS